MSKVKIQGNASGSGVLTIAAPNTSTDRTITLPDSTGTLVETSTTDALTATTNTLTTRVNAGGRKNIIINGDMSFAQRGTSSTSTGCKTVDRWNMGANVGVTQSQVAITSGGAFDSGFRSAYKLTNTGAIDNTATQYVSCFYYPEAQDIAKSGWNYKSASSYITISFWIKSSVAGTYNVNPMTQDGTQKIYPQTFSLSANTWTKVEKSFAGHADLTFNNDNGRGMQLHISPFYGTNFTDSGVSTSAWSTYGSATRFPDYAQNWGASTGATWEITGVQLEVGSTATDFEHRSYGEELELCKRYYQQFGHASVEQPVGAGVFNDATQVLGFFPYHKEMRAIPTISVSSNGYLRAYSGYSGSKISVAQDRNYLDGITATSARINTDFASSTAGQGAFLQIVAGQYIYLDSEL